jgi:hypothetical protein
MQGHQRQGAGPSNQQTAGAGVKPGSPKGAAQATNGVRQQRRPSDAQQPQQTLQNQRRPSNLMAPPQFTVTPPDAPPQITVTPAQNASAASQNASAASRAAAAGRILGNCALGVNAVSATAPDQQLTIPSKASSGGMQACKETIVIGRLTDDCALAPEVRPTVHLITSLLKNRETLKHHVTHCFKKVADHAIDLEGLRKVQKLLSERVELPIEAFGTGDPLDFERFDFKGAGTLTINQTYKMVKYTLVEYRKDLGGVPDKVDIPTKTLESAGFTLKKDLGNGAFGFAKLATNKLGKEICIKCFPKDKVTPTALDDLSQEFQTLNLLSCKVIAGATEMFQDSGNYYMVGKYYKGGDFETVREKAIEQCVDLTEDWWRALFMQVLEGLVFMHQQAIIHCDIKEPNLMIKNTDFSEPKAVIIDLGVTVSLAKEDPKIPHGTPGYVPPETLETLKWFPTGDLFSLGVVVLQMVANKVPRGGSGGIFIEGCRTQQEVFVATRKRPHPIDLVPKLFKNLKPFANSLLSKKRQERPTAVQALNHPWFTGTEDATQSWAVREVCRGLKPANPFATQGITKTQLIQIMAEEEAELFEGS